MTTNPVTGTHRSGSCANTSTPDGSSPVSSWASRSAACTAESSPGSTAPPGSAGCPACARMVLARWISRRSRSGPKSRSTAEWRPSPCGGTNRVRSSACRSGTRVAIGCSHSGRRSGDSSSRPCRIHSAITRAHGRAADAAPQSDPSAPRRRTGTSARPSRPRRPGAWHGSSAVRARSPGATSASSHDGERCP